uniref:Cilia- and flagella-associated protein 157 n=1 Tax=Monodelphis domestica TaxID=13616 RepID=A0A5F8H9U9_MONDO
MGLRWGEGAASLATAWPFKGAVATAAATQASAALAAMGPKKGSAEGAKKKGKKGTPSPNPAEEVITEEIRKFYQIQIDDLEKRIIWYQKKWDEVAVKYALFREKYEQLAQNKKEIVAFLKNSLNKRVFEITDLNEQLQGLQVSKEVEKEAFESQLAQVRHEFQETKDQLVQENTMLGMRLNALDEYRIQKEDLMAKFTVLEEQLKKEQEDYKNWIYALEKDSVLDKDRMKKEITHRVNKVAMEFRKVSALQIAETTKKVIQENVAVTTELAEVSDQTLQLYNENEKLKVNTKEMSKQLDLLEDNKKIMSAVRLNRLKLIWFLAEKCEQQQQRMEESEKIKAVLEQLEVAFQQLQQDNHGLRYDLEQLRKELRSYQAEGKKLAEQLENEKKRSQQVEQVLAQATFLLRDLLKMQPKPTVEGQFDVIFQMEQKEMLQQLMSLLSHAVVLGPHLTEFIGGRQRTQLSNTVQARCKGFKPLHRMTDKMPYKLSCLSAMFQPSYTPFNPKDIQLLSQTTRLRNYKISFPDSLSRFKLPAISLATRKRRKGKRVIFSTSPVRLEYAEVVTEEEPEAERGKGRSRGGRGGDRGDGKGGRGENRGDRGDSRRGRGGSRRSREGRGGDRGSRRGRGGSASFILGRQIFIPPSRDRRVIKCPIKN